MQHVLVTGGAGFMGSHLAEELKKDAGNKVVVLDDLSGGFKSNLPDGIEFINGSIKDEYTVKQVFEKWNFKKVYHLAAYAAEGLSHFIRRFNYRNNLIGSINLINESVRHDVDTFIFTSSIAAYGDKPSPMKEDMEPEPEDPYGVAKLAVEHDLRCAYEQFGLEYVIFRPHNVYGERQNIGDMYRNVVGIFMNQIMRDEPITIFGDGKQKRAFTYVRDIVDIIAQAPKYDKARNEVFNVGADKPYTVNQLADIVKRAMGKPNHEVVHLKERDEVKVAYSTHEKMSQVFGTFKETPLLDGVEHMAKWAHREGAKESTEFSNIEINEGLPTKWK